MQVINSYLDKNLGTIRTIQKFRLYHLSRPSLKILRQHRNSTVYPYDRVDQLAINIAKDANNKLTAVDCAGWYFERSKIDVTCLESDEIAKHYYASCFVEPDVLTFRPTYISESDPVLFKYPWYLKYATLDEFVNFLQTWVKSTTLLEFNPTYIQHNHLKYKLIDIVRSSTNLSITVPFANVWIITQ